MEALCFCFLSLFFASCCTKSLALNSALLVGYNKRAIPISIKNNYNIYIKSPNLHKPGIVYYHKRGKMTKRGIPFLVAIILWITLVIHDFIEQWLLRTSYTHDLLSMLLFKALLYAGALAFSSYILKKAELDPFAPRPLHDIVHPALLYGIVLGLATSASRSFLPWTPLTTPDFIQEWVSSASLVSLIITSVLLPLTRALTDQFFLLLCLLPVILLLLRTIFSPSGVNQHKFSLTWPSILITEIAPRRFLWNGIQILPNIISGIVAGWLFFTNGFWAALLASFVTFFIESISLAWSTTLH